MGKPLKISLDIHEDDELRACIKDMVRGQVLSIVRAEIHDEVVRAISKVKMLTEEEIERTMRAEIKNALQRYSKVGYTGTHRSSSYIETWAKGYVHDMVVETMKDVDLKAMVENSFKNREIKIMI